MSCKDFGTNRKSIWQGKGRAVFVWMGASGRLSSNVSDHMKCPGKSTLPAQEADCCVAAAGVPEGLTKAIDSERAVELASAVSTLSAWKYVSARFSRCWTAKILSKCNCAMG